MNRLLHRSLIAAVVAVGAAGSVFAQAGKPFDMSTERGSEQTMPAAPVEPSAPESASPEPVAPPLAVVPPAAPSAPGVPQTVPAIGSAMPSVPAISVPIGVPAASDAADAAAPAVETDAGTAIVRYIVPQPSLRLEGEIDQRSWAVFLSGDEAGRGAKLNVSYKNAIVVMPEASRLRVSLNGQVVMEAPIASADDFKTVTADIPPGLLQAGANLLRFQAFQRHRTDCSIQSTYELWTDIDPARTTLDIAGSDKPVMLRTLEDLPAVGYDARGRTAIEIVSAHANESSIAPYVLKLSQALAMFGGYPNPSITVSDHVAEAGGPGTLTVMLGPASELDPMLGTPLGSIGQPLVSFLRDPRVGTDVLAVSGGNWQQVGAAIDAVARRIDRPQNVARASFNTASWSAPDIHYFTGAETLSLAKLGVATQQFSGRRFRADFGVGVPSDFYAESYGEASILLDAAYTGAVLPASHIDIYVNGNIAATTRIVNRNGGIFRHLPIQVPFRHFRPGINFITIEAALQTAADATCAPGGSVAGPDRFVLFDTTEFSMPAFARIARRPNLAAFAGTGFPYNMPGAPVALVLGRSDANVLSASATLFGRLAMQAGRIIDVALVPVAGVGDRPAIFVGSLSQIPNGILSQLNIAETVRGTWKAEAVPVPTLAASGHGDIVQPSPDSLVAPAPDADAENTELVFDKWRTQLSGGGGWRGQISGFEDWMKRNFDISFSALRLGPGHQVNFEPRPKSSLLLAQAASPGGSSVWTLMTAPSDEQLVAGAAAIVAIQKWSTIGGQFSTFSATSERVDNVQPANVELIITQPLSLQNVRLIAANWLSSNILFYAIGLLSLCVVLGVVTSGLLHRLGRPS